MASTRRLPSFSRAHRPPTALGLGVLLGLLGAGLAAPSGCALDVAGAEIGGEGGGSGCTMADECDDDNPCTADECTAGSCTSTNDNGVVPDDGNDCTADSCVDGVASHPTQIGGPCGEGGLLQCNAQGECAGCMSADQCGMSNDCQTWACSPAKICDVARMPEGSPLADPAPGDCESMACDAIGNAKVVNDDADLPTDGMSCTDDVCLDGMPDHPPSAVGTACVGDATYCNAAGACVPCTGMFGCGMGETCFDEMECVSCNDRTQNGDETGVDCGGASCFLCSGETCTADVECQSGNCDEGPGICISCEDDILNGDETGEDCGGSCPGCEQGDACLVMNDCANLTCVDGYCCEDVCTASCRSCGLPGKTGLCEDLPAGVDDASPQCNDTMVCNGNGSCVSDEGDYHVGESGCMNNDNMCFNGICELNVCKLQNGDPCASDPQCETNNCDNNICAP
jgi:hypothetical protein